MAATWLALTTAWLAQLVGYQAAEREVAGSNPSWTTNQGLKITSNKIMLADLVSLQMILSLGSDVKPLVLSPSSSLVSSKGT